MDRTLTQIQLDDLADVLMSDDPLADPDDFTNMKIVAKEFVGEDDFVIGSAMKSGTKTWCLIESSHPIAKAVDTPTSSHHFHHTTTPLTASYPGSYKMIPCFEPPSHDNFYVIHVAAENAESSYKVHLVLESETSEESNTLTLFMEEVTRVSKGTYDVLISEEEQEDDKYIPFASLLGEQTFVYPVFRQCSEDDPEAREMIDDDVPFTHGRYMLCKKEEIDTLTMKILPGKKLVKTKQTIYLSRVEEETSNPAPPSKKERKKARFCVGDRISKAFENDGEKEIFHGKVTGLSRLYKVDPEFEEMDHVFAGHLIDGRSKVLYNIEYDDGDVEDLEDDEMDCVTRS